MNRYKKWVAILLVALVLCCGALAEDISTTVVMRVSRMTQNAIVNVGEDLSLEVGIEGVEPDSYQWYYEGTAIPGANQRVYNIINAKVEDSGAYRLEAFDEGGKMLVSMDVNARVVDDVIPKAGDSSLPVGVAAAAFVLAGFVLVMTLRRKTSA